MSRQGATSAQRNLTLTEELEKLEQSITLTLQEIDHNFNRAHRIVTSSILPVVEKYAEHSRNVWEGSKFWKQFFEASANVSLNGYEETTENDEEGETEETLATDATTTTTDEEATPSSYSSAPDQEYNEPITPASNRFNETATPSDFSSPSHTTPRAAAPTVAAYASPYETLRREVHGSETPSTPSASTLPSTPRAQTFDDDDALEAAPTTEKKAVPPSTARHQPHRTPHDPVLHRVLDKTYRIQATPHKSQPRIKQQQQQQQQQQSQPPKTPATATKGGPAYTRNLELDSSPLEEAPRLHSEMFGSPAKSPQRIPGVSVLNTPGRPSSARKTGKRSPIKGKDEDTTDLAPANNGKTLYEEENSDDDEYDFMPKGMSPPKTMQFHIPQSKLLKTPAKEASKQIMEDLLMSAGDDLTDEMDPDSPSVVKKGLLEEETF